VVAQALSPSAQRVQDFLHGHAPEVQITEHEASARTAVEAAALLGCEVGQIAKSIIFRRADADEGVLVITSGANRVDEMKVVAALGFAIARADAAFVREKTGYAIGGVPPVAHAIPMHVLFDEDLLKFTVVYAAGGTPNAVFPIAPQQLVTLTRARCATVRS
jgi:prolyl-tRNA editing enzyme YbaK/EbsC (Cys-tRNA(Pro) deacylase)